MSLEGDKAPWQDGLNRLRMTHELAFFPLKLVVFPQEDLNLHIFEPRYKELIQDCVNSGRPFGVCSYLDKLMPVGTEVSLVEISKKYEDGRMDIKARGERTFEILDFQNPFENKLYAGGKVASLPLVWDAPTEKQATFKALLEQLFKWINQEVDLKSLPLSSFTYAHKIGLKLNEEYQLLKLNTEEERLDFLLDHLQKILPVLKEIEASKHKIKMNGHFRYLDPLNF